MRRSSKIIGILLLASLVGLAGCDTFESGPSSVQDIGIQGNMLSPSLGGTVSPGFSPTFEVEYQGLTEAPTASTASDTLSIETVSTEGDPRQGGTRTWSVNLTVEEIPLAPSRKTVIVQGNTTNGRTIADTLSVFATPLSITSDFSTSFITVADYEGDVTDNFNGTSADSEDYTGNQREINASGETSFSIVNDPDGSLPEGTNQPAGSNGARFMEVQGSQSGSVSINRWANLTESDQLSFLVRPASSTFTLTVTLIEETAQGTERYDLEIPVPGGAGWLKVGIPFRLLDGFNPVAARSGGDGPFTGIEFSADANVNYAIDEILFGVEGVGGRAELHDFERSTSAYGGFNSGASFGFAPAPDSVDAASDGLTSRLLSGSGFWGYNYGGSFGPPGLVFLTADLDDVFTFRAKGSDATSGPDQVTANITVLNGEGGFSSGVTRSVSDGSWQTFEIPLSEFGADPDPSALRDPGIRSFDFTFDGELLIDDIKIEPRQ